MPEARRADVPRGLTEAFLHPSGTFRAGRRPAVAGQARGQASLSERRGDHLFVDLRVVEPKGGDAQAWGAANDAFADRAIGGQPGIQVLMDQDKVFIAPRAIMWP